MAAHLTVRNRGDEALSYLHRSRALIERAGRGCDLGIVLRDIGAAHAADRLGRLADVAAGTGVGDRPGAATR